MPSPAFLEKGRFGGGCPRWNRPAKLRGQGEIFSLVKLWLLCVVYSRLWAASWEQTDRQVTLPVPREGSGTAAEAKVRETINPVTGLIQQARNLSPELYRRISLAGLPR
jgi:hypothetical protein